MQVMDVDFFLAVFFVFVLEASSNYAEISFASKLISIVGALFLVKICLI